MLRPRGNRGELLAHALLERRERYDSLGRVLVRDRELEVERAWWHDGRLILKFRGIDSISLAETLAGADVCLPFEEPPPLEGGEFYLADLIGCEVIARSTNERIGVVADWLDCGGPPLLEVSGAGGERFLLPFARSICVHIDPAARRIDVDLPDGLVDLNRP